jgi:hypothetical protein
MVISGIVLTFTVISIWGYTELRKFKGDAVASVEISQVTVLLLGVFLFACLSAVVYAFAERGTDNRFLKINIAKTPEEIQKAINELKKMIGQDK